MLRIVRQFIEKHALLSTSAPVLVGLSGGADSVALLAVLVRLGYSCEALHCNFHLRGEESDRDEDFARRFAASLGVPFHKVDFDTASYASEHRVSIEMAARELRYGWFEEMRISRKAQVIAVAHHRDDSIETLLMNLLRGSGVRGMSGIRVKNGNVVRPLLCVSREEILIWLDKEGYSYVTDSTNLSDAYTRNFIRLRVLPLLEEINPAARSTISRTAEHLSAAGSIYLYVVEEARREVMRREGVLSIEALMRYPAPETILYELLKDYGFSRIVSDDIFSAINKESGRQFYSSTHRLLKDRDSLIISPLEKKSDLSYPIDINNAIIHDPIELTISQVVIDKEFTIERDKGVAYLDYDKLKQPLILRHWREGDWFIPFGMRGRKKLSDYFSDHKYNLMMKEEAWLICSGDDIVWLVGERTDDRYKIDKSSKRALVIKFLG